MQSKTTTKSRISGIKIQVVFSSESTGAAQGVIDSRQRQKGRQAAWQKNPLLPLSALWRLLVRGGVASRITLGRFALHPKFDPASLPNLVWRRGEGASQFATQLAAKTCQAGDKSTAAARGAPDTDADNNMPAVGLLLHARWGINKPGMNQRLEHCTLPHTATQTYNV